MSGNRHPLTREDTDTHGKKRTGRTPAELGEHLLNTVALRLGRDGDLYQFSETEGYYKHLSLGCGPLLQAVLGNGWSLEKVRQTDGWIKAALDGQADKHLPPVPVGRLLPVRNGLLDVRTGELLQHTEDEPVWALLPVDWDPAATCPTFDAWLDERCDDQAGVLLEAVGLMLLPSWDQRRAVFLFGPSRSGKSTLLRLLQAIVGRDNTANVSLADMDPRYSSPFTLGTLYGKLLNLAPEISGTRIRDITTFKQLTGGERVRVDQKYKPQFMMESQALHVFSANTLPEVGEQSSAFMNRVVPISFPHTFEGHEDPGIEEQLLEELPGIVVRLVEAVQRFLERGGYPAFDPSVVGEFAAEVDPVALFLREVVENAAGEFLTTTELQGTFSLWQEESERRYKIGKHAFLKACRRHLGEPTKNAAGDRGWRGRSTRPQRDWGPEADDPPPPNPPPETIANPTTPPGGTMCQSCQVQPRLDLEDECLDCMMGGGA